MARAERQRAGLSQADVAALIGVRTATVSEWETGRKSPGSAAFIALADALDVSLDRLVHAPEVAKTSKGATKKITRGDQAGKPSPAGNVTGA